jgi:hypothetical protein
MSRQCEGTEHFGNCPNCDLEYRRERRRHVYLIVLTFWGTLFQVLGEWILSRTEEIEDRWYRSSESSRNRLPISSDFSPKGLPPNTNDERAA